MINEEHLAELGRMMVRFQHLEYSFRFLIAMLLDRNDLAKGVIVSSALS